MRVRSIVLLGGVVLLGLAGCSGGESLPKEESMAEATKGQLHSGPGGSKSGPRKIDAPVTAPATSPN